MHRQPYFHLVFHAFMLNFTVSHSNHWWLRDWVRGMVLVLAVGFAYSRVVHAGFIWDDDDHLTHNPCIVGPQGLFDIWTTSAARICPLVLTTFWLEHRLWGLAPLPYHVFNVLLHAGNALVLWRLLCHLQIRGAWLAAAAWALHPVQVESVAWITELKNTQSGLFFFGSLLWLCRWQKGESVSGAHSIHHHYILAVMFGMLALASKSSTVVLPVVVCLVLMRLDGGWRWQRWRAVMPFALLAVASAVLAIWTQQLEGANDVEWSRSGLERLLIAPRIIWFYALKLAWPHPLCFVYPRWTTNVMSPLAYLPLASVILVAVVAWCNRRTWGPIIGFAGSFFVIALVPVLGLIDHFFLRYSFVGDHFQYLASVGPLGLIAAGIASLHARCKQVVRQMVAGWATIWIVALMALAWQHTKVFRDDETLWTDTLNKNPDCWMAHEIRGAALRREGNYEAAIHHYQEALRIRGCDAEALNNLATLQLEQGNVQGALQHYQTAIECRPNSAEPHNNLGHLLLQLGQVQDALTHCQRAVEIYPGYAEAHNNLANTLLASGRTNDALAHYQHAISLRPNDARYHFNLANLLVQLGQTSEACEQFNVALQLNPHYAEAHNNYGNVLLKQGLIQEAIQQYALAVAELPDNVPLANQLAWLLATASDRSVRDGPHAVALAQHASQLAGGSDADVLSTLAAAFAESGRIPDAIATAESAYALALRQGKQPLATQIASQLGAYRAGQSLPARTR